MASLTHVLIHTNMGFVLYSLVVKRKVIKLFLSLTELPAGEDSITDLNRKVGKSDA